MHKHASQHQHGGDHAHMIGDFRMRFWISLLLAVPVVLLAPLVQGILGYELRFAVETGTFGLRSPRSSSSTADGPSWRGLWKKCESNPRG